MRACHQHGLVADVPDEGGGHPDRFRVVAGDRHAYAHAAACGFAHARGADGVESADDARARQEFHRGEPRALLARGDGHLAVAADDRVGGVDEDLALDQFPEVPAEGGHRRVGHRHQQHVAERGRLARRACSRPCANTCRQLPVGFEVQRREHDFVAGLDPCPADRTAYPAGTERADLHFARASLRKRRERQGAGQRCESDPRGCLQEIATALPSGIRSIA